MPHASVGDNAKQIELEKRLERNGGFRHPGEKGTRSEGLTMRAMSIDVTALQCCEVQFWIHFPIKEKGVY